MFDWLSGFLVWLAFLPRLSGCLAALTDFLPWLSGWPWLAGCPGCLVAWLSGCPGCLVALVWLVLAALAVPLPSAAMVIGETTDWPRQLIGETTDRLLIVYCFAHRAPATSQSPCTESICLREANLNRSRKMVPP